MGSVSTEMPMVGCGSKECYQGHLDHNWRNIPHAYQNKASSASNCIELVGYIGLSYSPPDTTQAMELFARLLYSLHNVCDPFPVRIYICRSVIAVK